jgi:DUF1009 family protein
MAERIGLIAGNGAFPLLVLDAARAQGFDVIVAAIKEEASSEIETRGAAAVHWLSLGELSKLIETFQKEGVTRAVMAGQVKHKQIFSSIRPDWRLAKLLISLGTRNTDSLLGAVAKTLADEGITLENSTAFLEPLLAGPAVLTKREPRRRKEERQYGRAWLVTWRSTTSDKPWSLPSQPAWPWKPWRALTRPSSVPENSCVRSPGTRRR